MNLVLRAVSKQDQDALLKAFIALQLFGLVGLVLMALTVLLSNTAPRHITWSSFVFSWIISCISYTLLFVAGQLENPTPPFGLCLTQAALIYSAPPLTAASTLALVTQVYFNVRNLFSDQLRRNEKVWTSALLTIPYLMHGVMAIACLVLGLNNPSTVQRIEVGTYCNFKNRIPSKTSSITVAALMLPTIILEVLICNILRQNWSILKRRKYSPSTALRIIGFSMFGILAIALSIVFASSKDRDPELNIILSLLPAAAVLIFGTQSDILRVWMFWKPPVTTETSQVIDSRTGLRQNFATTTS
ncbi:hypothetical protein B0H34DRAFT_798458 [Crassisporium funariophilum]|nr:hypothetical protein B0H34DRAFT_798458 [Crassisporium funariophilum]